MSGTLGVILQIALRNLFASRWKTLIVGGIIAFGAILVVVGTSLLDGIDRGNWTESAKAAGAPDWWLKSPAQAFMRELAVHGVLA